jgi:pyrroloquinoline quinone biosynthesis protein E
VRQRRLADIWAHSPAFEAFRGTAWMQEPCRSCEFREIDFGGCRCQALAITGDAAATDPSCDLSPLHGRIQALAQQSATDQAMPYAYRGRPTRSTATPIPVR